MGDCNVCLDQDDGDSAEFWHAEIIKAGKPHKCYECGEDIPRGAEHQRVAMKYDGSFSVYRTCLDCVEIHRALTCQGGFRCLGILWEDIREYVFPEMTRKCIEKCETASARQKLVTHWNEWKFR